MIVSAPESFLPEAQTGHAVETVQHPGIYSLTGTIIFVDGTTMPTKASWISRTSAYGRKRAPGRRGWFPRPGPRALAGPVRDRTVSRRVETRCHSGSAAGGATGPKGTVVYVIGQATRVEVRDVKATDWQVIDG